MKQTGRRRHATHLRMTAGLGLAGLVLSGCSQPADLRKHTFTIELGQDVYANPALYADEGQQGLEHMTVSPVSNGVARKDNRFVSRGYEYLMVGEYDFVLENGGSKTPFVIKIKDTRPPTVISEVTELDAMVGQRIDWSTVFPATDISGISYEAPFDTTATPGDHDITVKISDRFGNAVEKPVKVKVSG